MQKKAPVEIDAKIAKLRDQIAAGRGSEIILLQFQEALEEREAAIRKSYDPIPLQKIQATL